MIDMGANVNARDHTGKTALHWAASSPEGELLVFDLIKEGADTEMRDKTRLHTSACPLCERKVLRCLVPFASWC